jgi:hypothetical protein
MILRLFVLFSVLLCACSTLAADEASSFAMRHNLKTVPLSRPKVCRIGCYIRLNNFIGSLEAVLVNPWYLKITKGIQ